MRDEEILHVIVGHGLPTLYLNTLNSFRAVCPDSQLLVVDNRSPQESLRRELLRREAGDPRMQVVLREDNALTDPKVGALYQAYELAFAHARARGYRFVHILQADMQSMFWDQDLLDELADIYARRPDCVNIYTCALSKDRTLMRDLVRDEAGDVTISDYAMTDTGIYDLERWDRSGMEFRGTEVETAQRAAAIGLRSVVCRWPCDIQVPWPAVIRKGRQVGREVPLRKPFLCRPLSADAVSALKLGDYPAPLEDLCVPWGWWCLSPMYVTDTGQWYYLNFRRRDLLRNGWRNGRPRLVTEGLDSPLEMLITPHRPGLARLLLWPMPSLIGEIVRRLVGRRCTEDPRAGEPGSTPA